MSRYAVLNGALLCLCLHASAIAGEGDKYVGVEWTWFTDYIYFSADWTVESEPSCEVEVGVGSKIRGKPRGGKYRFRGHYQFTTYGFGAIHIRAIAGEAPCLVRLSQGQVAAVGVYGDPSIVKGAIRDGKIVYEKIAN